MEINNGIQICWGLQGNNEPVMDVIQGTGYYPIAFNQAYIIICTCLAGGDIVTSQCFATYFSYWIGDRMSNLTARNYFHYICIGI